MATNISLKHFHRHVEAGNIIFNDGIVAMAEARIENSRNEPDRKVLWTDASALGLAVGIAIVWKQDFTEELQEQAEPGEQEWVEEHRRSTQATGAGSGEQEAAFVALEKGEQLFAPDTTGLIVVCTDSEMEGFRRPRSCGGWLNPDSTFATKAAIRAVELADKGFHVEFKACPGHDGILGNELADYWARRAINLGEPRNNLESWRRAKLAVEARDRRRTTLRQLVRASEEQARVDAANARLWNQTAGTTTAATSSPAAERTQEEIDADWEELMQFVG